MHYRVLACTTEYQVVHESTSLYCRVLVRTSECHAALQSAGFDDSFTNFNVSRLDLTTVSGILTSRMSDRRTRGGREATILAIGFKY